MEGLTSTGQSVKEWLGIRIGEYRARGLVREWREDDGPAVINPVGCEPDKPRFVLDSRWFNQLTDPPDIRLETLQDLRRCLEPGSLLCTVDLKDGFTHVPLAKDTIAKFAFRWEGVVYDGSPRQRWKTGRTWRHGRQSAIGCTPSPLLRMQQEGKQRRAAAGAVCCWRRMG